jgi:hypothetical protein
VDILTNRLFSKHEFLAKIEAAIQRKIKVTIDKLYLIHKIDPSFRNWSLTKSK